MTKRNEFEWGGTPIAGLLVGLVITALLIAGLSSCGCDDQTPAVVATQPATIQPDEPVTLPYLEGTVVDDPEEGKYK